MTVRAIHGDCLDVIPRLTAEGVVCDACVCDPPYHLQSTVKRWANAQPSNETYVSRAPQSGYMAGYGPRGFMGQKWDGGDIAFRPETWNTVASVMLPGAFLVAFGGTRTYHRLTCAIEDAGFVIQDCLMWLYGTGFPKNKAQLKPAYEPIILAYKPGGKRTMQVDECRIAGEFVSGWSKSGSKASENVAMSGRNYARNPKPDDPAGRWPANIFHDGSDEVVGMFPESAGQQAPVRGTEPSNSTRFIYNGLKGRHSPREPVGDDGSAARFFFSAKAGAEDRWGSRHPTVKPVEIMKWLVQLVTPGGGLVIDPFAGSGTTGVAALASGRNAILIEREDNWFADIQARIAFYEGGGTHSAQAKGRGRKIDHGPLFAEAAE